jgi:hypothetical protein
MVRASLTRRGHGLPQLVWDRLGAARDLGGFAHERYDLGVFVRGCQCLAAFPLAIVHDLGAVEAKALFRDSRGNVAGFL